MLKFLAFAMFALLGASSAHPGEPHNLLTAHEITQRRLFMSNGRRALQSCADSDYSRALKEQAIARRVAKVAALRDENQNQRRLDAATALAKSHKSSLTGISASTDKDALFGLDVACLLEPQVTVGPYYVKGELIRNDIREKQPGIDLYVDMQFVDMNTCQPVENLYVDFWHCNTTGVYSGVIASGNGDSSDTTLTNATFFRGIAPTDSEGVVEFTTKFPGFYTGRTTHVHMMANYNGKVLENNTYAGGAVSHVGQLFFDQDLITAVSTADVYKSNSQAVTLNARDSILAGAAANAFDPLMEYVYLGDSVEDGIFAWISVAVDMTIAQTDTKQAVDWTTNGGVAVSQSGTSSTNAKGSSKSTSTTTTAPSTTTTASPSTNTTSPSTATSTTSGASPTPFALTSVLIALHLCMWANL